MTSQGTAHERFTRAIQRRDLFQAELALHAVVKPERFPAAAVHWHGRIELETPPTLTRTESQFALAALAMLGDGQPDALEQLRTLLRRLRPTLVPRIG